MNMQGPAPALAKNLQIAAGLRRLYHSECVLLPGNRDIPGIVAGDLQEDAGIRPAFVRLSRGVQEARSETQDSSDLPGVANLSARGLQRFFMRGVHLDVGQHSEVIAGAERVQVRAQT